MLSQDAEEAVFQVNVSKAIVPKQRPRTPRLWRRRSSVKPRVLTELAVGRMVAAGEAYLLMRATRKLQPALLQELPPPTSDPTMDALRGSATNFGVLAGLWKSKVGLDLDTIKPSFQLFSELRHLRHVLVHRLGYWQPGLDDPAKKKAIEDRIVAQGIDPDSYRGPVPLDADEAARSAAVVLDMVDAVDPNVP